jgi:hypothetical protein
VLEKLIRASEVGPRGLWAADAPLTVFPANTNLNRMTPGELFLCQKILKLILGFRSGLLLLADIAMRQATYLPRLLQATSRAHLFWRRLV